MRQFIEISSLLINNLCGASVADKPYEALLSATESRESHAPIARLPRKRPINAHVEESSARQPFGEGGGHAGAPSCHRSIAISQETLRVNTTPAVVLLLTHAVRIL